MSMNYHYMDLYDEIKQRMRASFACYMDYEDLGISYDYVVESHKQIMKIEKQYLKRLRKEDRKYQRKLKRDTKRDKKCERLRSKHKRGQQAALRSGAEEPVQTTALSVLPADKEVSVNEQKQE